MKLSVGSVLRNQVLKLRYQKRDERLAKPKSHAEVGTERTNSKNPACFLNFGLPHRQTNPVSRNVSSLRPGGSDVGESREVFDGRKMAGTNSWDSDTLGSTNGPGSGGRFNCTESRDSVSRSLHTRPSQSSSIAITSTLPPSPTASTAAATTCRRSKTAWGVTLEVTSQLTSKMNEYWQR